MGSDNKTKQNKKKTKLVSPAVQVAHVRKERAKKQNDIFCTQVKL